jgi:dTDP-4-dehydrorhamnose 3,5-epimerase
VPGCDKAIRGVALNNFTVTDTPLAGLKVITRHAREDSRGFLCRIFCREELGPAGWLGEVVQVNHTWTARKGTVRGMHYQLPPHEEMKLVSCIRGVILDVAVDIRRGSPTFLQWHAEELGEDNRNSLLIPEGFAHGFQALTDDVEMLYLHSAAYNKDSEAGLNPLDESLCIGWMLPLVNLSDRDSSHAVIDGNFQGIKA